jgi:hypothetical protein
MTYDVNFLKEYNNRLLNLNYDLKAFVLQYFYKKLDNKIDELQSAIASKYHIDIEKSSK